MRYAIKVNQSAGLSDVSRAALNFIRALEEGGHDVIRVFFYHDGVREGFGSSYLEWAAIANRCGIDLVLCSQALDHRGFANKVSSPFIIGGLGLWVDACLHADRVITFGVPSDAN